MPVWFTDDEYAILRAACSQMMPSDQGAPGAEEADVPNYIDTYLGAFSFDPPRIWAGVRSRDAWAATPGSRPSTG